MGMCDSSTLCLANVMATSLTDLAGKKGVSFYPPGEFQCCGRIYGALHYGDNKCVVRIANFAQKETYKVTAKQRCYLFV